METNSANKSGILANAVGAGLGVAGYRLTKETASLPCKNCLNAMQKIGGQLTQDEFLAVKDATSKILTHTGLDKKGVSFVAPDKISDALKAEIDKSFLSKFYHSRTLAKVTDKLSSIFKGGSNAAFLTRTQKIIVPNQKNMSLTVFHEVGHAMNKNFSKIGRMLQKCRPLQLLAVPILLVSLLKNKKTNGEQPNGVADKTTTFIKNNAGKLTFATFIPTLIEEGMASLKGNKLAAKLLNPSIAKKVAKTNKIAYLTYVLGAIGTSAGVYVANKIKDSFVQPKKNNC